MFNYRESSSRRVVENVFENFGRCAVLQKPIVQSLEKTQIMVLVDCYLHNYKRIK